MAVLKKKNTKDPIALLDKAIARWRELYVPFKRATKKAEQLEQKVDTQKATVIGLMISAGLESHDSPLGKVSLQSKPSVDWAAIAADIITELGMKGINVRELVDVGALEKKHTKAGEVFVRAPQAWSGKAG